MFNLNRAERTVIVILVSAALLGLGVNYYKKVANQVNLRVEASELSKSNINIDKLILKTKLVNINKATPGELRSLSGIGPTLAQRIVDYRSTHGRFEKIEDIIKVDGIGPDKFNKMKEFLVLQ